MIAPYAPYNDQIATAASNYPVPGLSTTQNQNLLRATVQCESNGDVDNLGDHRIVVPDGSPPILDSSGKQISVPLSYAKNYSSDAAVGDNLPISLGLGGVQLPAAQQSLSAPVTSGIERNPDGSYSPAGDTTGTLLDPQVNLNASAATYQRLSSQTGSNIGALTNAYINGPKTPYTGQPNCTNTAYNNLAGSNAAIVPSPTTTTSLTNLGLLSSAQQVMNPTIKNPFYPTFRAIFKIPDTDNPNQSIDYQMPPKDAPPDSIISFEFIEQIGEGAANSFKFTFFDSSVTRATAIPLVGQEKVKVQWGYVFHDGTTLMSPMHSCQTTFMDVKIDQIGAYVTIAGMDETFQGGDITSNPGTPEIGLNPQTGNISAEDSFRTWRETRISDIVQKIADKYNARAIITPTKPIPENPLSGNPKIIIQTKPDSKFITEDLVPLAISEDGKSNYLFYIDTISNTFHFHPPFEGDIVRVYTYAYNSQGPQYGVVKQFQFEQVQTTQQWWGQGDKLLLAYDKILKKDISRRTQPTNMFQPLDSSGGINTSVSPTPGEGILPNSSAPKLQIGQKLSNSDSTGVSGSNSRISFAKSEIEAAIECQTAWQELSKYIVNATLDILGDPLIRPNDIISITVRVGSDAQMISTPHFGSGIYEVYGAIHTIARGEYNTSLDLKRDFTNRNSAAQSAMTSSGTTVSTDPGKVTPLSVDLLSTIRLLP